MHLTMRLLNKQEQFLILPLWERCFPDYWEQLAVKNGKIPYEEVSFAAFDKNKLIAHCGIIPYKIWCNDRYYPMAGVASVATAPEYRKQGIAAELCKLAANWAQAAGFVSLPLYTGFFRVYESAGWHKLQVPQTVSVKITAGIPAWRRGKELNASEKSDLISIYNNGENFNGKVCRQDSGTLHSWTRIFDEPDFLFSKIPGAYAIKSNGVVIELGFADDLPPTARKKFFAALGENGSVECYLPPAGSHLELLDRLPLTDSPFDAMHGERPMVLDITESKFHTVNQIYFPVVDKF